MATGRGAFALPTTGVDPDVVAAGRGVDEVSMRPLRQVAYERVCESYHAIDDFRTKLLGLLPVATGTGVFLLLSGKAELIESEPSSVGYALGAIGVFGFLFTLGLFAYELFGITKCHYLIEAGKRLEDQLGVKGHLATRPEHVAGVVNEPFASAVIYPACMAAWAFVALVFTNEALASALALAILSIGFAATLLGVRRMATNQRRTEARDRQAQETGP